MNVERILLAVVLIGCCILASRLFRTVINPCVSMISPWCTVLVAQEIFAPEFPFGLRAAMVVGGACLAFALGSAFQSAMNRHRPYAAREVVIQKRERFWIAWPTVSFILFAFVLIQTVLSFRYFISAGLGTRADGSIDPYGYYEIVQNSAMGMLQRGSATATYIAAAILTLDMARVRRITAKAGVFLAVIFGQSLLVSTRAPMLLILSIIALTWATVFAGRIGGTSSRILAKLSIKGLLAVTILISVSWVATERRYGFGNTARSRMIDSTRVSLLGAVSGLSLYLDRTDEWWNAQFSGITVAGPLSLVGLTIRTPGVYIGSEDQYITASSSSRTNQYTGLRLILDDVGFLGMILVMFMLGLITTAFFYSFYGRPTIWSAVVLSNLYLLLVWLPVTLQSYYAFWTIQFVGVGGIGVFLFRARQLGSPFSRRFAPSPALVIH